MKTRQQVIAEQMAIVHELDEQRRYYREATRRHRERKREMAGSVHIKPSRGSKATRRGVL